MVPSTFYSRDQVSLFTRYTFPAIKTKAKWNEPTFSLHHGIGYGSRSEIDESLLPYGSMERGYMEGGLILDKVLISGFSGLGVGCFYRYGAYMDSDWKNNIVPKISIAFNVD
jgi:hypothetical protein